jgi:DNA-binding SARP family transcriptional activator/ATP/maltotriose-dependent transcriptional regulator MalT
MVEAPVTVLEAPSGYGKTTLCVQLAAAADRVTISLSLAAPVDLPGLVGRLDVAVRRHGVSSLSGVFDPDDPEATAAGVAERVADGRALAIVVDEVQRADADALDWLADLAAALTGDGHLVVAGRRVGAGLGRLLDHPATLALGPEELAFDVDEVRAVVAPTSDDADELAAEVSRVTGGWPAAVALAATAWRRADGASVQAGGGVLRSLVEGLLTAADPPVRAAIGGIARVPLVSAAVAEAVGGPGTLDAVLDTGLPIRFRADGWGIVPDAVRDVLDRTTPLDPEVTRTIADLYADGDQLVDALGLLDAEGDHDGVAALLSRQAHAALTRAGLVAIEAVVERTPDEDLARHPDGLVALVRAADLHPRLRAAWLERAERLLADGTAARRAADTERSLDEARLGDLDGATAVTEAVLATAAVEETVTRARALMAHAWCALVADTTGSAAQVADELTRAGSLFRLAGERDWEAFTHRAVGYGCHFTAGAFDLAMEHLEQALALTPAASADRADTLTCLGEVLIHAGRLDDAEVALQEAAAIGRRLADDRMIAYAAWSGAELAAQRRDAEGAATAIAQVERHPGGWFERLAGVDFLAHAAEIQMILGDEAAAVDLLTRAEEKAAGTAREDTPEGARARYEVMYGDPVRGEALAEALDRNPAMFRRDRSLRLLLRAAAVGRQGRDADAAALVDQSRRAAADIGDPGRIERREPELLALALPGVSVPTVADGARVALLGRFAVERDGTDVTPQPGRTALLVKALALRGPVTSDEVVDLLWSEIDLATGKARLRNVLSRIRSTTGDLVVREEDTLRLAAGTEVDVIRFEQAAEQALAAPGEERAGLARGALTRYGGELLPGDRYEDWAVAPRERLRRRHLALLDVVAAAAQDDGDLDEAGDLLERAIAVDPLEEARYVELARALIAQGRPRRAREVADQAVEVVADLGMEPGRALQDLVDELDRAV